MTRTLKPSERLFFERNVQSGVNETNIREAARDKEEEGSEITPCEARPPFDDFAWNGVRISPLMGCPSP